MFNFSVIKTIEEQSEFVISLVDRLDKKTRAWFYVYLDDYVSGMMSDPTYRKLSFSFLEKYGTFIPFLPQRAILENAVHIAPCVQYPCPVEEENALELYLLLLLQRDTKAYQREVVYLGNKLLHMRAFKKAIDYYRSAYPYVPKERLYVLQESILFALPSVMRTV